MTFYFKRPIDDDRRQREKMDELKDKVGQFRHDPALIADNGVNPALGLRDAYTHLAPMVDTDVYMRWLLGEVRRAGCRIARAQDRRARSREQEGRWRDSTMSTPSSTAPGSGPAS